MRKLLLLSLTALAIAAAPVASEITPGATEHPIAAIAAQLTVTTPAPDTGALSPLFTAGGPGALATSKVGTEQTCCETCQNERSDCFIHCVSRSLSCEQACEKKYQRCIAGCPGGCP